nr:hypothetical protein CFP56_10030 [Quercus suber]
MVVRCVVMFIVVILLSWSSHRWMEVSYELFVVQRGRRHGGCVSWACRARFSVSGGHRSVRYARDLFDDGRGGGRFAGGRTQFMAGPEEVFLVREQQRRPGDVAARAPGWLEKGRGWASSRSISISISGDFVAAVGLAAREALTEARVEGFGESLQGRNGVGGERVGELDLQPDDDDGGMEAGVCDALGEFEGKVVAGDGEAEGARRRGYQLDRQHEEEDLGEKIERGDCLPSLALQVVMSALGKAVDECNDDDDAGTGRRLTCVADVVESHLLATSGDAGKKGEHSCFGQVQGDEKQDDTGDGSLGAPREDCGSERAPQAGPDHVGHTHLIETWQSRFGLERGPGQTQAIGERGIVTDRMTERDLQLPQVRVSDDGGIGGERVKHGIGGWTAYHGGDGDDSIVDAKDAPANPHTYGGDAEGVRQAEADGEVHRVFVADMLKIMYGGHVVANGRWGGWRREIGRRESPVCVAVVVVVVVVVDTRIQRVERDVDQVVSGGVAVLAMGETDDVIVVLSKSAVPSPGSSVDAMDQYGVDVVHARTPEDKTMMMSIEY